MSTVVKAASAPVLVVADFLNVLECAKLIDLWSLRGGELSFTMREDENGALHRVYDRNIKSRTDYFIEEVEFIDLIKMRIKERIAPLVKECFRFELTRFEDFRIGCYEASEGGHFSPHRDDSTVGTAHRKFALSVNLNEEDYIGGHLCFPEYPALQYKTATGSACIFSGGALHAVRPVERGKRFALLSFLYGEEESSKRRSYYIQQMQNISTSGLIPTLGARV
jgi:hypothetical protein